MIVIARAGKSRLLKAFWSRRDLNLVFKCKKLHYLQEVLNYLVLKRLCSVQSLQVIGPVKLKLFSVCRLVYVLI